MTEKIIGRMLRLSGAVREIAAGHSDAEADNFIVRVPVKGFSELDDRAIALRCGFVENDRAWQELFQVHQV